MARALFETENITGTINGLFALSGSGANLSAITSDLDGSMEFKLQDGAWQGIDVWQQIRTARAIYKREAPPEPRLPARTEFSNVDASGPVTDGVFTNDNLLVQMPFLRITGTGTVDLASLEMDYSVQARVLEQPELMSDVSDEELADFTEALIPIRIRGPLASPSFRPDIEAMFRQEVERAIEDKTEELKKDLLDRLIGGEEQDETADGSGEGADTGEQEEEQDVEDVLKDRLKDLFPR
jgi:AsmA protein